MADYWMKLYIEILDDPKMATMPDRAWRRTIEIFLVAKKLNKDGHLPDTRQIAWLLRMSADELEHDLIQIASTGIVVQEVGGWFIPQFAKRQAAVPDAERKAQERDRKKSQQYYGNVTDASRIVTQRTEAETEAEADTPPSPYSQMSALIATKLKMGEYTGGAKKWNAAIQQIFDSHAVEADIDTAITWMDENNRGIAGPWSIVNPVVIAVGQRERGNGHKPEKRRGMRGMAGLV